MADRTGQQLGNYRLTRLLGKGGFAEVYLGEHLRLGTHVAVKILYTRLDSPDDRENFQKEARTIAHLDHPHIVRVFDFDVVDDTPFLIMNYAPKGTLRQRHRKGTPLPLTTIIAYIQQIADALQYAHDQRIIHRDIKPENMLMGARNELLLSDFGIATIAQSSRYQSTQEIAGTMAYMAPEQIGGKPRPASDQYSLAILVYEWLSGDRPFHGSPTEIIAQHLAIPPSPLHEKVPAISPNVEHIIMTALAKDPKQRFATIQAFATALEQASTGRDTSLSRSPALPVEPNIPSPSPASPMEPNILSPSPVMEAQPLAPPSNQPSPPTTDQTPPPSSFASTREASSDKPVEPPLAPPIVSTPDSTPAPATPISDPISTPSTQPVTPPKSRISRRTVLVGLAGLVVAGSGATWLILSRRPPVGTTLYTYRGHTDWVIAVAWSPDGRRIASASFDKTVQVWEAATGGNVYTYRGHSNAVDALAWSPDGKRIASASYDKTVQVWEAATGGNVYTYRGHSDWVQAVAWSPDGKRIASGSDDQTVHVWDAANRGNVYIYRGHSNAVYAVAWSPNGRRIASASFDQTVQVWDATTGGNVYTYRGHSSYVNAVAWSPDGRRIASGSGDKTVQVWDATTGGNVYTYRGHSSYVFAVAWLPDGRRIASGGDDKTVQLWEGG